MSSVHFIGGEKGGVGKSVVARLLAQYFIDRNQSHVGVDADKSHGALLRYYGESSHAVDLDDFSSADQIMDRALGADRRVLVDLPAQSSSRLKAWMKAGGVVGFARDMDVSLVFWHVSDGGYDSVMELERVLGDLGTDVRYVIVRNLGRSRDFAQLDESQAMEMALSQGALAIDLPQLDSQTMYKIDRFGSSFWAATHTTEGEFCLSPMERRRSQIWQDDCYAKFDAIAHVL